MTTRALAKADEILELDLDPGDSGPEGTFGPTLRAQTSTLATILATQTKVDEHRLRRQQTDRLPELLRMVNEVAARIPRIEVQAPAIDVVAE